MGVAAEGISGLVLAGGQSRRMGGMDKGLQSLRGKPMIEWVLERFRPQVNELLISANQNADTYASFGFPVLPDRFRESGGGVAGPLAGLHSGLCACSNALLATVPCDSPFLPADLVSRLHAAMKERSAEIAVAHCGARAHPVFMLARRSVLQPLTAFMERGGRRIDTWLAEINTVEVHFEDEAAAFSNINTREELQSFEVSP
jgi:molybdenum cofactor guanylyltransferase